MDFYFAWDQIASFGIAKINLTLTVEQQNFLQISLEQAQLRKSSMLQQNVLLQQFRWTPWRLGRKLAAAAAAQNPPVSLERAFGCPKGKLLLNRQTFKVGSTLTGRVSHRCGSKPRLLRCLMGGSWTKKNWILRVLSSGGWGRSSVKRCYTVGKNHEKSYQKIFTVLKRAISLQKFF